MLHNCMCEVNDAELCKNRRTGKASSVWAEELLQLRCDAGDVGFAARLCFCRFGLEQFALGAAPILEGIAGSAVAFKIDFIRAL